MIHDERIATTILDLLDARAQGATICPSEVARAIAPSRWRPLMSRVRDVAATMAAAGEVELRQRGEAILPFEPVRGPLRIALGGARQGATSLPARSSRRHARSSSLRASPSRS